MASSHASSRLRHGATSAAAFLGAASSAASPRGRDAIAELPIQDAADAVLVQRRLEDGLPDDEHRDAGPVAQVGVAVLRDVHLVHLEAVLGGESLKHLPASFAQMAAGLG